MGTPPAADVIVLGIYACDLTWSAARLPAIGETLLGSDFRTGCGGKGSNQTVAARRAGASVGFITRVGDDAFGRQARTLYADEGVIDDYVTVDAAAPTGAAFIYLQPDSGANAIIVTPGAAGRVETADVDAAEALIAASSVFITQLETPLEVSRHGLAVARRRGVTTILNPAPAAALDDEFYPLIDYFTPNESEAAQLAGVEVRDLDGAAAAADVFLAKGVGTAIITLGERGVLLKSARRCEHIAAFPVDKVVDTTGAGDAFNGGFAAALAAGRDAEAAARFGCATAALAVARPGTAEAMPRRAAIDALLANDNP